LNKKPQELDKHGLDEAIWVTKEAFPIRKPTTSLVFESLGQSLVVFNPGRLKTLKRLSHADGVKFVGLERMSFYKL